MINSDEEVGSPGSAPLIAAAARGKRAALTYEPSALPDGTLAGARPGSGNFSILIEGRSAHAGRNPEDGRNAVLAAADLALRLGRAGAARAGGQPGEDRRRRAEQRRARSCGAAGQSAAARRPRTRRRRRRRSTRRSRRSRPRTTCAIHAHGGFGRAPKPIDARAQKLFELVRRSGADLGQKIGWRDTGGVCDGNNIAACGVPVVDTMGARGGAIHSDQEFLIVESLVERAQLSALDHPPARAGRGFVSFRVRPARGGDFDAIYEMATLTGGGFTNLPADKGDPHRKLSRSEAAFAPGEGAPQGDLFLFVLENAETGEIRGTCQVFSRIGIEQPFYSYRISKLTQTSPELGRTFHTEMLNLCTDFNDCSEVGGLFLHPEARQSGLGLGLLLARSRYLFIKRNRERFADKMVAELRGVIGEDGGSRFWDAIAGRFFGMGFQEADAFNSAHGTQFIADLMPKTPIYTAMLSDEALAVMGKPHPSGAGAMRMLEAEGFSGEGYVDIFDGGPTMSAATDKIRTDRRSARAGARRHPGRRARARRCCSRAGGSAISLGLWLGQHDAAGGRHPRCGERGPARPRPGRFVPRRRPLSDGAVEINFDGIVGPSHNYAGLSRGNLAATASKGLVSLPARRGAAGRREDAAQSRPRPGAGLVPAAPAARPGLARRARHRSRTGARRAARRRFLRLGDVGGQCRDRLARARHRRRPLPPYRRQPQDDGAPQPRMAGDPGPAPARLRRSGPFRGPRARAGHVRRRGRGQPHAAVRRPRPAGRRGLRLRRARRRLSGAPA